jgi:hypothetical protein
MRNFISKKFVKYLSKCKLYKKYDDTADSTENTVGPLYFIPKLSYIRPLALFYITWLMKFYMPEKWTYGTS